LAIEFDLENIQETLSNLDPENIGSWPMPVKAAIFLSVFLGVFVAGQYFLVKDIVGKLDVEKAKEEKLFKQYESKSFQAANLDEFRTQMEDLDSSYSALLRQLPQETEVPGLLEDITNTGLGSGLKFTSIDLGEEEDVDFYSVLPIDLKVTGGYHGIAGFVSGVAALPRIVTLHNFVISQRSKSGIGNNLSMSVKAKTYRYKQDSDEEVE